MDARVVPVLNWSETALDLFGNSIGVAVTPNGHFFASDGFAIDRSVNSGATWTEVTGFAAFAGGDIAYDPANPATMIAGRSHGTLKSVDGGANWFELVDLNGGPGPHAITFDPNDPLTVYAGVEVGWGVYKSTNGGAAWTNVLSNRDVFAVEVDPGNSQVIFAGAGNYSGYVPGVLKSTDGGANWTTVLPAKAIRSLAIDPANPQRVFAGTYDDGIYATQDGGASWAKVSGPGIVSVVHDLAFDPRASTHLYAATGGQGVFHSADGGTTWAADNSGLTDLNVVAFDIQRQYPFSVLAATYGGNGFTALAPPMPPGAAVAAPADGGQYGPANWPGAISGSATPAGAAVDGVSVSIRRGNGNYWDGDSFSSPIEEFLTATGTSAWSLPFPPTNFPGDGNYTVRVKANDTNGVTSDPLTVFFSFDATPPAVTVVPLTTNDPTPTVTGTISEGTLTVTVNAKAYAVGDGNLTVDGTVWTLMVPPSDALADGTYDVVASASDDLGNTAADATGGELSIDTTPPSVTVVTPADDATGVAVTADLSVVFGEPIRRGGGDILIRRTSDGAIVESIPVGGPTVTVVGSTATIDRAVGLASETGYFVDLPAGAFEDVLGNGFAGLTDPAAWNFTTAHVNSAPTLDPAAGPTLTAILGGDTDPAGDGVGALTAGGITDVDAGDGRGVAVVGLAGGGYWQFSLDGGASWTDFGDVGQGSARLLGEADRVRFVPAAGFAGPARLTYRAWDRTAGTAGTAADLSGPGATGGTAAFSTATATATVWVAATLTPVSEDSRKPRGDLVGNLVGGLVSDADAGAVSGMAVAAVTGADRGTWQYSVNGGRAWKPVGPVSSGAARLLRGTDWLRFVPAADFVGTASLWYHAWDQSAGTAAGTADLTAAGATGGATAFSVGAIEVSVRVTPVNDPPALDVGGDPPLTPVAPGATDPAGDLVEAILGPAGTDLDGDPVGMAVTTASGPGAWQVQPGGAGPWTPLAPVSPAAARLLGPTDRLRFVPTAGASPSARLSFKAWDRSIGLPGGVARPVGSAFSKATETARLLVTTNSPGSANTAPVLGAGAAPALTAVTEDAKPAGDLVGDLIGASITDPDPGARRGIAVAGFTGTTDGTWEFSTTGGRTWKALGRASDSEAVLLRDKDQVRFRPGKDFHGTAALTYRAWDQTRGSAGGRADLTAAGAAGGSGPFSVAESTVGVTVLAANDRPTLPARLNIPLTPVVVGEVNPAGDAVDGLLAGRAFDIDGDAVGMAVTAAFGAGVWEVQAGGVGAWATLGPVSAAAARLVGPADQVRFRSAAAAVGPARLTFKAWDGTAGSPGGVADTRFDTATSTTAATAGLLINSVDDRPVLAAGVRISLTPVLAGGPEPAGDLVSALLAGRAADPDAGAELGLAVTAVGPAAGTWQVSIAGGAWTDLGAVSVAAPRLLRSTDRIRFVPAGGFVGTAAFSFKVWDAASADATGASAFSRVTGSAVVTVNTAPAVEF